MNIGFRIATDADREDLLEMMEAFYAIDQYPFNKKITAANIKEFISNEHLGVIWMITTAEQSIGYLVLTFGYSFEYQGRDAFIDEFFIKEAFRSQGVGDKTMNYILDKALNQYNIKAVHLEVEKHNLKGNKLYVKKGFEGNDNRSLMTKKLIK